MSQIGRRKLLVAAGTLAATPWLTLAEAQQQGRVGYLASASASSPQPAVLLSALAKLGWEQGRNLTFEKRFAEGRSDRLPSLAKELLSLRVQVIVITNNAELEAVRPATREVPIVIMSATNPIVAGLAKTLAQPTANVTGVMFADPEFSAKSMQLLKELIPDLRRLATLYQDGIPSFLPAINAAEAAAGALGIEYYKYPIRSVADVSIALANAREKQVGALRIVDTGPVSVAEALILEFAAANSLPTSYVSSLPVDRGGLMAYAPDYQSRMERVARFVDKILKGAKPAELPFEYPTRYHLVINLKTARRVGIKIPQSILLRADRVIE